MKNNNTKGTSSLMRNLIVIIIFTAVSAGMGLVKFPSPVGSIAMDSAPGFFCAAFFSPWVGAFVGALGHLASAATGGFPFGFLHIYIAIEMLLICFVFGLFVTKYGKKWILIIAGIIAVFLNGVVAPWLLTLTPIQSIPNNMATTLMPILSISAAVNVFFAGVAIWILSKLNIPGI